MKFLIIHNEYSRRGGEESVVALQAKLLAEHGHEVIRYSRRHGDVSRFASLFTAIRNPQAVRDLQKIINLEKPDIAIVHNLFPIISAAILPMLRQSGVRIMMTLHNYRIVCPNGLFYTQGHICERCGSSSLGILNCTIYRCQGSFAGSAAWSLRALFSERHLKNVDLFMALSEFQKQKITEYTDIDPAKFVIVPNCVDDLPESSVTRGDFVGFVGRLSSEKGVELLFETARALPGVKFRVAGERAENYHLSQIPPNIELLGLLNRQQLADFYCEARCIILTSSCYEGFPLTVIEAMYYRATVIVPGWGALPEMVEGGAGILYTPNSAADLAAKISESPNTGNFAHQKVTDKYSSEQYYNNIMRCVEVIK